MVGLSPGSGITLTLVVHDGPMATGYWKYGPTPDDAEAHWYEFGYDPATGTGAEILGRTIRLHLVDGGRGDGDLTANGVIADPGGPGGVALDEFLYLPVIWR